MSDEAGGRDRERRRESRLAGAVALLMIVATAFLVVGWPLRQGVVAEASVASSRPTADAVPKKLPVADVASSSGAGARLAPGPVDVGFAQDMSLHHEQALEMARLALAQGTPRIQSIAQGIANQQLKEIGYMQGWLMLWHAPAASPTDDMPWMREAYAKTRRHDPVYEQFIESCVSGKGMPGLATVDEMAQLATLRDGAFDGRFLAMMIRHHQGAVVMARFTSEHAETEVVRDVARAFAAEQRSEMMQMMTMLTVMKRKR